MKVLTLWQPYAWAIAKGIKLHETRSWQPGQRIKIGEKFLIHAAKRPLKRDECLLLNKLGQLGVSVNQSCLHFGAIVAEVKLLDVMPVESVMTTAIDELLGDYSQGHFAWKLSLVQSFQSPMYAKGFQGVWNYEPR